MTNIPRVGTPAQVESFADTGGLPLVVGCMLHADAKVRSARVHMPTRDAACGAVVPIVTRCGLVQVRLMTMKAMGAFACKGPAFRDAIIEAGAVARLAQVRTWHPEMRVGWVAPGAWPAVTAA